MHPANLALRFLLEMAALAGFGMLAYSASAGGWRVVALIATLGLLMALWGVFAVPDDPSRSGSAPISVSGKVRLALELVILLGGATAFYWTGQQLAGFGLAALVLLHYALSRKRIAWLLSQ